MTTQASFKAAVLVSGGMDSFIAYHICCHRYGAENVIPLYVRIQQPYMEREDAAVRYLYADVEAPNFRIINADLCNILPGVVDRTNPIIPARNLLLCYYGALFSENVFLSSLNTDIYRPASELMPDNQLAGHAMIANTLSTLMMKKVNVLSAIDQFSKGSMLAFAINQLHIPVDTLAHTLTCYEADVNMQHTGENKIVGCGNCSACTRRAVAWRYAAFVTDDDALSAEIEQVTKSQFLIDPLGEGLWAAGIEGTLNRSEDGVRNVWMLRTLKELANILVNPDTISQMRWFTISGVEEWLTTFPFFKPSIVRSYKARVLGLGGHRKDHPNNIHDSYEAVVGAYKGQGLTPEGSGVEHGETNNG